jgi:HNH endonuclease
MSVNDSRTSTFVFQPIPYPDIPGVEFRDCLGIHGWCVSDHGDVWSRKKLGRKTHPLELANEWRPVKLQINKETGYFCVSYRDKEKGRTISVYVHKLVLEAFVGPAPEGMLCRHENDVKSDNNLKNLSWGTPLDNAYDFSINTPEGPNSYDHIITDEIVIISRELRSQGFSYGKIYEMIKNTFSDKLTYRSVYLFSSGVTWKHLPIPVYPVKVKKEKIVHPKSQISICDARFDNFVEIPFPAILGLEFRYVIDSDMLYCVSDNGRVFSRLGGRGIIKNEWHEIKSHPSKDGYPFVSISKRGIPDQKKVHILVLETFVGPRPSGLLGLHKDDIRTNNHVKNLYWGSYQRNALDRSENGKLVGEGHGMSKLTDESVIRIRELRSSGMTNSEIKDRILDEFGIDVSEGMISHAAIGRTWGHLDGAVSRASHVGENNAATQATEAQVLRARDLRRQGMSFAKIHLAINEEFSVNLSYPCVYQFTVGISWKHIPM